MCPAPDFDLAVVTSTRSELGEGPSWWEHTGELARVDIANGLALFLDPATGRERVIQLDAPLSAVVARDGGGMIAAVGLELVAFDADGRRERSWPVPGDDDIRLNDCRVDPLGRLWAGTMSKTRAPRRAALYRLNAAGQLETVLAPTTLSNGMGWSPGGGTFYFVDSTEYEISAFESGTGGDLGERRVFARIDSSDGLPDGIAVDADGGVWLALFGGGALRRYHPDGSLDLLIPLPVTNPTCPAFGGDGLATLYVTSARIRLDDEQLAREPAGALLALRTGHHGIPTTRFNG